MSAVEALKAARAAGVELALDGDDLVLKAASRHRRARRDGDADGVDGDSLGSSGRALAEVVGERVAKSKARTINITTNQTFSTPEKTGAEPSAPSASAARPGGFHGPGPGMVSG
jgi:hypothetical protein